MTRFAADIAAEELADLRRENAELRRHAPPAAPRLAELRQDQKVSPTQLAALYREQRSGRMRYLPADGYDPVVDERDGILKDKPHFGERRVLVQDETGLRIRHTFADPESVWGPHKMPGKRVTNIDTGRR